MILFRLISIVRKIMNDYSSNQQLQDHVISPANLEITSINDRFTQLEKRVLISGTDEEKISIKEARIEINLMEKNRVSNDQFLSFMKDNYLNNMIDILAIECNPNDIINDNSVFKTLDNLFNLVIKKIPAFLFRIEQHFDGKNINSFLLVMQKYCEYDMLTSEQKSTLKLVILNGCKKIRMVNKCNWTRDIAVLFSNVLKAMRTGNRVDTDEDSYNLDYLDDRNGCDTG